MDTRLDDLFISGLPYAQNHRAWKWRRNLAGTAVGLIFTKKYRKQGILLLGGLAAGVLVGNVFLKNLLPVHVPAGWIRAYVY